MAYRNYKKTWQAKKPATVILGEFTPNQYHEEIARAAEGPGNFAVVACPGSGKSTTCVRVILPIVKNNGDSIAVMFGKENRIDFRAKAQAAGITNCQVETWHSLGLRLSGRRVDVEEKKFLRPGKWERLARILSESRVKEYGEAVESVRLAKSAALELLENAMKCAYGLPGYPAINEENLSALFISNGNEETHAESVASFAAELFADIMREPGIDYPEMPWRWLAEGKPVPQIATLILDEAQDTTALYLEAVRAFVREGARLIIVGDPNQSIHGWNGALPRVLELMAEEFAMECKRLPRSFRCSMVAIEKANALFPGSIEPNENTRPGSFREITESLFREELESLTAQDGIMARIHAPLVALAMEFLRQGRGFVYKRASEPAWAMQRLIFKACGKETIGAAEAAGKILSYASQVEEREMAKAIARGRQCVPAWVSETRVYADILAGLLIKAGERGESVKSVVKWLDSLAAAEKGHGVTLSTFHAAKGAEFDRTFILGDMVSPRANPNDEKEMEEERRVAYVAFTRAKDALTMVSKDLREVCDE